MEEGRSKADAFAVHGVEPGEKLAEEEPRLRLSEHVPEVRLQMHGYSRRRRKKITENKH